MSVPTEAELIRHCEDVNCSLGRIEYDCPACGKGGSEFDAWFKVCDGLDAAGVLFNCEKCKATLLIAWCEEECAAYVHEVTKETRSARRVGGPQLEEFGDETQVFHREHLNIPYKASDLEVVDVKKTTDGHGITTEHVRLHGKKPILDQPKPREDDR